jgi:hypothetical protein
MGRLAPAASWPGVGTPSWLTSTTAANAATAPSRAMSLQATSTRRSNRSVMAPAGRENSSHGSRDVRPTSAMRLASRVSDDASHTTATVISPSPRFVNVEAVNSFQ